MNITGTYLCGIGQLADKLSKEIGTLPYEKFAEDTEKIESAVLRFSIMKEGWSWLPGRDTARTHPDRLVCGRRQVGLAVP